VTLDALSFDADHSTRRDAASHSISLSSFYFVVTLIMIEAPMQHLASLSQYLQKEECDLVKASAIASAVIESLKDKRNSDE